MAPVARAQIDLRPERLPPASGASFLQKPSVRIALGLGVASLMSQEIESEAGLVRGLERFGAVDGAVDIADLYGNGATWGIASLGLWGVGTLTDRPGLTGTGRDLATAWLASGAAVWALKLAVHSRRPNGGAYSFPSGHTAAAFAVAPVISRRLGWKAGAVSYAVATLTGLARVEDQKHYLGDVLAGAAIGILIGSEVAGSGTSGHWNLTPADRGVGLSLHF